MVRVLQAVLWLEWGGLDTVRDEVLAEVEDARRQLCSALLASGVLVAGPRELGECRGAGPHLAGDDGVIDLFGPERGGDADDALLLLGGQALGEVVVVDALPRLVRGAPRAAAGAEVEVGHVRVRVLVLVVAGVVANPAAVTAVEVQPVRRGDDDVVAESGQFLNVSDAVVPGLHDNVLGNFGRVKVGEDHVLPHDQPAVLWLGEYW